MATHQDTDAEVRQPVNRKRGEPPSANDAAFAPRITQPALLALDQGATRVPRAQEHLKQDELWQGNAYPVDAHGQPTGAPDQPVYFRLAGAQTMAAELLGALMAQALSLPTPAPYVLRINAGVLPGSRFAAGLQQQPAPLLCVATHDLGAPTFAQLLAEHSAFAKKMLRQWHALLPATAFDEWIANLDRNFGNILYVASELWLIDHADAFGGPQRKLLSLGELVDKALTNKLAILFGHDSAHQRRKHLEAAHRWLTQTAGSLNVRELARHASHWQSGDEENALVQFLTSRLALTHRLLCARLGYPQLQLQ